MFALCVFVIDGFVDIEQYNFFVDVWLVIVLEKPLLGEVDWASTIDKHP